MPVAEEDAVCSRFDGPPRVVGLGFQVNNATLVGPVDMFKDKAFDISRDRAQRVMDYMRRHGPFEPHRLPLADMEYTTLPKVMTKFKTRFKRI
jgi:fructose 1,6-bisphosphate aldolase/phosphatase